MREPPAASKWVQLRDSPKAALLLPGLLALASALCWRRPEKTTAVLLALAGALLSPLGLELSRPLLRMSLSMVSASAAKLCSDILVRTTLELLRHEERTDLLLEAASEAMRKAMTNKQVQSALKETVIDALGDEHLQQELIATLTKAAILSSGDSLLRSHLLEVGKDAIVRALKDQGFTAEMVSMLSRAVLAASQNTEIRDASLDVVKSAVTDALKDEGFMDDMMRILTRSAISASKDHELREALLCVTKEAVVDALKDEGFMQAFQHAMCQGLKDSNIYRSAAKGVVKSLNPFGGGD